MPDPYKRMEELFGEKPKYVEVYEDPKGFTKTVVVSFGVHHTSTWYYAGKMLLWFTGSATEGHMEKMAKFFEN